MQLDLHEPSLDPIEHEAPGPDWRERVERELVRLRAQHGPMPAPQPGDWVLSHPEPGQTFAAYLDGAPSRPTASRSTPGEWHRGVLAFYEEHGLAEEAERTRRQLDPL